MMISLFERVENTVEKGENAGYQHFLLFPQCFTKPSSTRSFKVGIALQRVNPLPNNRNVTFSQIQSFCSQQNK